MRTCIDCGREWEPAPHIRVPSKRCPDCLRIHRNMLVERRLTRMALRHLVDWIEWIPPFIAARRKQVASDQMGRCRHCHEPAELTLVYDDAEDVFFGLCEPCHAARNGGSDDDADDER